MSILRGNGRTARKAVVMDNHFRNTANFIEQSFSIGPDLVESFYKEVRPFTDQSVMDGGGQL